MKIEAMDNLKSIPPDPPETPLAAKQKDPHILEYFTLLARQRKPVIIITLGTSLFFLLVSLLLPQEFTSEVTILPPEKQSSGMGGLMSFLSGSSALDMLKAQENPALDLFQNIVESRMMAEEVALDPRIKRYVSKFDTAADKQVELVHSVMECEALRNGMMTLTITLPTHWLPGSSEIDTAKQLSAYMANLFIERLDHFNRDRLMTKARDTRIFVELAYHERMRQLDSTYASFQAFQELHKTISLPEQLASTVQSAAKLAAQVQQLEIELAVEEHEMNPSSAKLQLVREELQEAKEALKKYDDGSEGEYAIALRSVPELSRSVAGYTREIKLLEQLTAYLRQEVEQERINEQRDLPSLQVLDKGMVPLKRSFPKRFSMLLLGLLVGFVLAIFYVTILTYFSRVRSKPNEHTRFLNFARALRFGQRITAQKSIPSNGLSQSQSARTSSEKVIDRKS